MVDNQLSKKTITGIRCQDIQTGLHGFQVDEFETITKVGVAARISTHIRGGDVLNYNKFKSICPTLFGITKLEFPTVMTLLQEVEFINIIGEGDSTTIIPKVPYFGDLYETLGEKAAIDGLSDHERASIDILQRLSEKPIYKDTMKSLLGIDPNVLDRVLRIGKEGSYFTEIPRPQSNIILTPIYFGENPEFFAKSVEKYGEDIVGKTIKLIRKVPGTPFQKILDNQSIGQYELSENELELIKTLVSRGILQTPSIETTYSGENHFLFTPPVGTATIAIVEKEIYEKAMAVIACVRQGEHFGEWRVRSPSAIIRSLLADGWLRKTTIAKEQYKTLVVKRICRLEPPNAHWQKTVLIDTPENRRALELAAEMLEAIEIQIGRGLNSQLRDAIYSDFKYQESLRGYGDIKKLKSVRMSDKEMRETTDEMLEFIMKGG